VEEGQMDERKLNRRQVIKGAGALGVAASALGATSVFADEDDPGERVTWDIVSIVPPCVSRGGHAGAKTEDGAHIDVTGHGTFPNADRCSKKVTGGGTWKITPGSSGDPRCFMGSGTYRVIELLSWHTAPGGSLAGTGLQDCTGDSGTPSAGLATLRVHFDNGQRGTLTVSCHLPGAPNCMFEGITATMAFEDFWNHDLGGFTLFHVGSTGGDD
jgi:hypothetical protein